jgi:Ser/Thr protein kinase RdoA (MazF antagonist)
VELIGPVGAGKSALRPYLDMALAERGLSPMAPTAAVDAALGRSSLGPILRPMLARSRVAAVIRALLVDVPFGLATLVTRPRRGASVVGAILRAPLPWWHRRRILRLWIEATGRSGFVRSRLRPGEVLVLDEGPVHRAVNLFAWRDRVDAATIRRYLDVGPRPDLVVMIDAAIEVAGQRLGARGLPKRLRGRDETAVVGFLDRARAVLDATSGWLDDSGVPAVSIINDGSLEDAAGALRVALGTVLGADDGAVSAGVMQPPVFRPRIGLGLPRPRRPRTIPGRPARPGLDSDTVTAVLAACGLRPLGVAGWAPGGRGTSVIVDSDSGRLLVKRYKPTVDVDALHGEHAILRRLEDLDFPATRLVATLDGDTLLERADGRFAVFRYLDGYRRADDRLLTLADARILLEMSGATLAALHDALASFVPPTDNPNGFRSSDGTRVRDLPWLGERLAAARTAASSLAGGDPAHAILAGADRAEATLADLESELTAAQLPRLVIHGDYGPYNLLVRSGRPLVVVDFELARLDWRLTDLATALPRFARGRRGPSDDRAIAFATGYLERSSIRPSELDRLPLVGAYLALRRAAICLARWADTMDRHWLTEASEKMDLASAYRDGRHPYAAFMAGGSG